MKRVNWWQIAGFGLSLIAGIFTSIASNKEMSKSIAEEVTKQMAKKP